jgi:hypothetical protein
MRPQQMRTFIGVSDAGAHATRDAGGRTHTESASPEHARTLPLHHMPPRPRCHSFFADDNIAMLAMLAQEKHGNGQSYQTWYKHIDQPLAVPEHVFKEIIDFQHTFTRSIAELPISFNWPVTKIYHVDDKNGIGVADLARPQYLGLVAMTG